MRAWGSAPAARWRSILLLEGTGMKGVSLSLPRSGPALWLALAAAILVIQTVVSSVLKPSSRITYNSVVSCLVLLLAAGISAQNALRSSRAVRLFWSFLVVGCGLWALSPGLWAFHYVGWARYPDFWLSTSVLFLHIVLMIAAVVSRPHLQQAHQRPYRTTVTFLLLLFFLVFVYAFFLVPYDSMQWNRSALVWFAWWYLAENFVLMAVIARMIYRAQQPWKSMYWQLLGASALYACIAFLLNITTVDKNESNRPGSGFYELFYVASACWFVGIAWRGHRLAAELEQTVEPDTNDAKYAFPLAMLAMVSIPVIGVVEFLRKDEHATHVIRLLIVLITFLLLAIFVFVGEYLARRDLTADVGFAHDRLRLALESSKIVGWDWDVRSGHDFWFGDLQTMFGIPADHYSGQVEDFRRRVHPVDRGRVWKAVNDAMKTGGPYAAQFRVVRLDGQVRWVDARGKFSYDGNGEPERMLGMATDITETKRAEQAVRESQDRLSLLLESTAEGIYGMDREGRCTFVNPACLQQLGYERAEELLGKKMHELIHHTRADGTPYSEEECQVQHASLYGDGVHLVGEPLWRRDGTFFFAEYWAYPQRKAGKIIGSVVTFIDITDRKRAEEALRQSEALKGSILLSLENQIAVVDKNGFIREVNEAWVRSAQENGMTEETAGVGTDYLEALRRSASLYSEAEEVLNCVRTVMDGTARRCRYDYYLHWTVPPRWYTVTVTPLQTAEGGVVVAYRDVSDVRRRDAALAEAQRLASVGSWQWDAATDTVTWSEELYRIVGRDPALPTVPYPEQKRFYTPESWKQMQDAVEEAVQTGKSFELDLEMVRSDGDRRWLVLRGEALRSAGGRIVQLRGTVHDISERKRAEQALRESEERFRLVANTAPVMIWMTDVDKLCTYCNQTWLDFTGRSMEESAGHGWLESVHPQDRERSMDTYSQAFARQEEFRMEYRVRRHDDQYRWILDSGRPRFNTDGSFAGYIGSCVDVTERKLAEDAISSMGRRLIVAQEEERTRIARELHDDIGQRLALLSIELETLQRTSNQREFPGRIYQILKQTSEIASEIQAISHRLHSSKLEYLGLAAAARGYCAELSEQQDVRIDFLDEGVPRSLPHEIEMSLFRVLQEALRNAVKHGRVRQVKVELRAKGNDVHLTVLDSGVGFDPATALHGKGLGLVSMQERVRLVHGELTIDSAPNSGTSIHARVPLIRTEALAG
jgi:PAS domain S-box-containing protein